MTQPTDAVAPRQRHWAVAGACDCHVHVFGPQRRFPFVEPRRYTPADATIERYLSTAQTLGIERAVLTAPSVHGLDNGALLNGLAADPRRLRGIVMVDRVPADDELRRWHEAGVRGVRTQLKPGGDRPLSLEQLRPVADAIAPLGWHVEIHADVAATPRIDRQCAGLPVPVVIEHMGHMPTDQGVDHPGFQSLLTLLRGGGWIKLSGAYINSIRAAPYDDVAPFVAALLQAAPDRAVWGSNWPHPHQDPVPDDALLASLMSDWTGGDEDRLRSVLADNPARLYDFPHPASASSTRGHLK